MGGKALSVLWEEWKKKQQTCEELYSEELPESYQYWGNVLIETFSKFCVITGSILDVGCGNPDRSIKYFGGTNFYYMGLDPFIPKETSIIPIVRGLAEDLPFGPTSFDNVALISVLDHVVNPKAAIFEASRVLRVGGYLYIMSLVWTDHFNLDEDEYHLHHFSVVEIYDLIPENFTIEATQFIPYKEDYRRVMYLKARKDGD